MKEKLNIIFDHSIFLYQRYGGISRYFFTLANHFTKNNDQVKIAAMVNQNSYLRNFDKDVVKGISFEKINPKLNRFIRFINKNASRIYQIKKNIDIIHETYYALSPSFTGKSAKRILTVYDMIHELYPNNSSNQTKLKRKSIDRADHIIAISNNTKSDLCNIFNINPEKVSVIHLGVENFEIDEKSFLTNFFDFPYILFVGQRENHKNFLGLLQAFVSNSKLVENFKLVTFGGGRFNKRENEEINKLGISNSIIQVFGDDSKLSNLYRYASAFIYPSIYEGFGLPPLEAMLYSCPVISSNTSSMPEIIGDAGEFFDPFEISSIAFSMERVLFDGEYKANLIVKGKKRAKEFTWEKCARKTRDLYLK